eukprot:jgi/Tetstr1/438761/TSEL_027270.t1
MIAGDESLTRSPIERDPAALFPAAAAEELPFVDPGLPPDQVEQAVSASWMRQVSGMPQPGDYGPLPPQPGPFLPIMARAGTAESAAGSGLRYDDFQPEGTPSQAVTNPLQKAAATEDAAVTVASLPSLPPSAAKEPAASGQRADPAAPKGESGELALTMGSPGRAAAKVDPVRVHALGP